MAQDTINESVETSRDNAVLLLAAAEELGLGPAVVETTGEGTFRVPQRVVDKAGLGSKRRSAADDKPSPRTARKRTAKKAAATVSKQKSE